MMNAVFDDIAAQYDRNRGGEARGRRFAEALLPRIDTDRKVLEMGVGTGVVAGALEAHGCDVTGIDVSKEMLKRAVGSARTLIWSDMNTLPFLDGYFGSVYAVWALHLVDDITASLREIRRVLRPGGYLQNCAAGGIVTSPPDDRAGRIVAEMQSALRAGERWPDGPDDLARLSEETGFVFEHVSELRHLYRTSVAQMIDQIETNSMLTLQMATPEQLTDVVEPALAELRGLPDHSAPIERERVHRIAVLRAVAP